MVHRYHQQSICGFPQEQSCERAPTVYREKISVSLSNPGRRSQRMCRNIKMLFNFDPPVTDDEVRAAALQFVRKISGFNKPSKANEAAFHAAIKEVALASARLLTSLETTAPRRSREEEAARAKARNLGRFGEKTGT